MAEKKSFALRIDAETMKAIEKWAADEFRSINGQLEWMLDRSLKEAGRLKDKKDKNQGDKKDKDQGDKKDKDQEDKKEE
jgi:hypothetical protein